MKVSDELRAAKDKVSDNLRAQDPHLNEIRGVGIGMNQSIMVLLKDADNTTLDIPATQDGFKVKTISVGDPRAL